MSEATPGIPGSVLGSWCLSLDPSLCGQDPAELYFLITEDAQLTNGFLVHDSDTEIELFVGRPVGRSSVH